MTGALHARSLVAVFAHPDDESLACGGLLALCADAGMHVILVCATRGEDGRNAVREDDQPLASVRSRELAEAADTLGIQTVTWLDFDDGMLPWTDGDSLEESIAAAVSRWSPAAIVTFDEDGLYWHPDHIALHRATTTVVAEMGRSGPALYYVSVPEGGMRTLVDGVQDRVADDRRSILGVEDADAFGTLAPVAPMVVNVATTAARKLAALLCHRSQTRGGPFSVMTDAEAVSWLGIEHLRRAPVGNVDEPILELLPEVSFVRI